MKKIAAIIAAAGIVGSAGAALAFHEAGHESGRGGNNECFVVATGETYKNPGAMFRALRDTVDPNDGESGKNPKQWIEDRPAETVGEFIARRCTVEP